LRARQPERLTRDVGTSALAQGCTGQLTTAEVERFDGNLPPIQAYDPRSFRNQAQPSSAEAEPWIRSTSAYTPATELVGAIGARKLSAVEITSTVLDRIARLEPKLNAFAHLGAEQAMEAAAEADSALARGAPLGPLHGIPVTIKDLEPVRGMPFEGGTYLRRGDVAPADNVVVSRLRNAGAIILARPPRPNSAGRASARAR